MVYQGLNNDRSDTDTDLGPGDELCSWQVRDPWDGGRMRHCLRLPERYVTPGHPPIFLCPQHSESYARWSRSLVYAPDATLIAQARREADERQEELDALAAETGRLRAQLTLLKRQRTALTRELRHLTEYRSYVYVFRRESDGCIKIGTTVGLASRLRTHISEQGPIEILGILYGDRSVEGQLHDRFAAYRIKRSEYFWPEPEVMEWAATLTLDPDKRPRRRSA